MDSTRVDSGLTSEEALVRLAASGPNEIRREKQRSPLLLLLGQFRSPLIWLLVVAAIVSGVVGDVVDTIAIATILVLNALVGFFQEYRAERAILALRSMTAPRARVVRDGHAAVVPAATVVPGDVLLLEAGDIVAADGRLIEAAALSTNEAPLTGESVPVEKDTTPVSNQAPLAERRNAVFMGTALATGTGRAVVYATGMSTELGKIAHLLATAQESETPLQRRLKTLGNTLMVLCLALVVAVAVVGALRGMTWLEVFLSAVSLAVAAVPEGLPAIVTIALAIGVQRMAARNVLVRRLPAVETLGSVTVICTDKTGTLTTGVMAVRELWGQDHAAVLKAAASCCDAELAADALTGTGDPTEVALLVAAAARGINRPEIEGANPRVAVNPFDSERRRMSIRRQDGLLYVKGAIEGILERVSDRSGVETVAAAAADMAARGLRVLAVALGQGPSEEQLRLVGLVGLADPPRTEAIEAVAAARRAGIRTVMITGDHPLTAAAIARELGIVGAGEDTSEVVHARATPEDKLRIVRAWKARGAVVAMTGDGVNDAPALREAHIGVAMGKTGTEVTREASDMVLADDNFASIVAAVREGRGIFDNIRRSLTYLLAGNTGELAVMLGAAIVGLPLPLIPLQILWINLITDGLPALALVMEPTRNDVLSRPPRPPEQPMLARGEWLTIGALGLLQAGVTLAVFVWALRNRELAQARSLAFSTLVFGPLWLSFAFRSRRHVVWELGLFTNIRLVAVVALSVVLQVVLLTLPATQALFQVGSLPLSDWLLAVVVGLLPVTLLEVSKLVRRRNAFG